MTGPHTYLANLSGARATLWCYLIWYSVIAIRHFDPSLRLWLTSFGLSVIIGVALVLNAEAGRHGKPDKWQRFRFFLAPFCVSSFAALVKDKGFVLIISPHWQDVALGTLGCASFLSLVRLARRRSRAASARPREL